MKSRSLHRLREASRLLRAALKQLDKAARELDASGPIASTAENSGEAIAIEVERLEAQIEGQA